MFSLITQLISRRASQYIFFALIMIVASFSTALGAGDELYFTLSPATALPQSPSSLLVQSSTLIKVPAGAVLNVHLLRDDSLVATSKLVFQQAYDNDELYTPVPLASFIPLGSSRTGGQPLPGAVLTEGLADLAKVAAEPAKYRLLWVLSAGIIGTPGRAIATGPTLTLIDLKLSAVTAAKLIGDQKPGSVLFFSRYTSSATNPVREDTRLTLTNSNPAEAAFIRIFLVNAATCEPVDFELCLTPQQTLSLNLSDLDPGIKGYIVAVATNAAGEPIQFNWLIGNVVVKQSAPGGGRPLTSILSALAIAKRKDGSVPNAGGSADMIFDDVNYDRLPGQLAIDSVPSQINGVNTTLISLYRPISNLAGAIASADAQITVWGRNQQNQVVSSTSNVSIACYSEIVVSVLRLSPLTVNQLLPVGAMGWAAASAVDLQPLIGAQINAGEFQGGSNARPLSFSTEYHIRVPVSPVTCQAQ